MAGFPDRVQSLREVIAARHSPTDGGWPHRLDVENAPSAIPSTAQVLEMLRVWKREFREPEVQDGLSYLARAVKEHTRPKSVDGPGRGEFARYPAYALWGLTRYPQGPFAPDLKSGIEFCISWLVKNRLAGGGWSMSKGSDGLSFTVTMPAVHALDRLSFHPRYGKFATTVAHQARQAIVRANRGTANVPWWTPYGDAGKPSGAATAMAVLTLAGGDDRQRRLARRAIGWLLNNPATWVNTTETDMRIEDRSWQMLSFSLGLRAVLHPCAKEKPNKKIYRSVIQYWEELWVDKDGAWTHYPGAIASTTGSFGVIVAARALKQAFPFDPATHFDVSGPSRKTKGRSLPRPRLTVTLFPSQRGVQIVNQHGSTVVECEIAGPAQWRVLELVALQHLEAAAANDQLAQTSSLEDLTEATGSSPEACAKAIDRVNATLTRVADQDHSQFLPSLIEDISPRGANGRCYGLEEVDVVVNEDGGAWAVRT